MAAIRAKDPFGERSAKRSGRKHSASHQADPREKHRTGNQQAVPCTERSGQFLLRKEPRRLPSPAWFYVNLSACAFRSDEARIFSHLLMGLPLARSGFRLVL